MYFHVICISLSDFLISEYFVAVSCEVNTKVIFIYKTGSLWWNIALKSLILIDFFACVIFYWLQNHSYWYQYVISEVNYIWPAALEMHLYLKTLTPAVLTHLDPKPQTTWTRTLLFPHSNLTLNSSSLHPEAKSSRKMEWNRGLNLGSRWELHKQSSINLIHPVREWTKSVPGQPNVIMKTSSLISFCMHIIPYN